jgi:hypothetical protein
LEVAEYLLNHGAEVNAQDKGISFFFFYFTEISEDDLFVPILPKPAFESMKVTVVVYDSRNSGGFYSKKWNSKKNSEISRTAFLKNRLKKNYDQSNFFDLP